MRYRLIVHNIYWSIWNLQAQDGGLAKETWEVQLVILKRPNSSKGVQGFWSNYSEEFAQNFQEDVAKLLDEMTETSDRA